MREKSAKYPSIVFFGTPDFAAGILYYMIRKEIPVSGVVTAPDKPAGRGRKILSPPVKTLAQQHEIPVLQPKNLKDPAFLSALKQWNPELQVVVAFRMLPESVWALPELGTFNLHASLLPQYRGAAPIQWALINGETVTGVTTFFISHEIDTGKIIFRKEVPIAPMDNAGTLTDKLMNKGAELVTRTIEAIITGNLELTDQQTLDTDLLKKAPKITREDTIINWNRRPTEICNLIRGMSPSPGATTSIVTAEGIISRLKIYDASPRVKNHNLPVPSLVSDGKTFLDVAVPTGYVHLLELQLEGRKKLPVEEFLRGFRPETVKING
ncbi:MAG: methionyl-tRNA formyltransferase [Chlorobi bacterium]|nr:methionyl-tRNA formyltransferase [Chlorobiota bacterium]